MSVAIPKASALLFEGLLLSMQALVRQFPRGEFLVFCRPPPGVTVPLPAGQAWSSLELGPSVFRSTRGRLSLVTWLLARLQERLRECLGLLSNRQMVGALINTLTCLAALTRQLLEAGGGWHPDYGYTDGRGGGKHLLDDISANVYLAVSLFTWASWR